VLPAHELLAPHADLLQTIRERSALAVSAYQADIAPTIAAFAEFVQQLPASEAHHHAGPGGLLRHTLEVVSGALALRRGAMLPPGAAAEEYRRQEHRWTVAVLLAALLHDAGKPAADLRVTLLDPAGAERLWQPLIWSMPHAGALWYRVAFAQASEREYARHARLAAGLLQRLVPASLLAWLAESALAWEALLDYLTGEAPGGPIGLLVRQADSASVARDLVNGPRTRFASARARPLVERMMEALRCMLAEGGYFALSRSGADAWVEADTAWFVSRTLANQVRTFLAAHDGESGIPADNNRLFDVWQDHRACLVNPATGRAIWRVDIEGEGYRLPAMTVLAFRVGDLFETPPSPMRGRVVPCAQQDAQAGAEPESAPKQPAEAEPAPRAEAADGPLRDEAQALETLPAQADVASLDEDRDSGARTSSARRGAGLDKDEARALADEFMQWIAEGISSNHLLTNNKQAFIHGVPQGLLLVSPIAFKSFVRDCQGGDYETVQRAVLAQGWHRKGPKGVNFVRYQIALAGVAYGAVTGVLLPEPERWISHAPPVNPALAEATE
jgi:integrating conjugative element relaxase (TIGR03760 family)